MERVSFIPRSAYEMDAPTESRHSKLKTALSYLGCVCRGRLDFHLAKSDIQDLFLPTHHWPLSSYSYQGDGMSEDLALHLLCFFLQCICNCFICNVFALCLGITGLLVQSYSLTLPTFQSPTKDTRSQKRLLPCYCLQRISSEGEGSYNWLLMYVFVHTMLRTVWLQQSLAFWLCIAPNREAGTQ